MRISPRALALPARSVGRSPSSAVRVFFFPSRCTTSTALSPGASARTDDVKPAVSVTFAPLSSTITSPSTTPAFAAGLSSVTLLTMTPVPSPICRALAMLGVRSCSMMPRKPCPAATAVPVSAMATRQGTRSAATPRGRLAAVNANMASSFRNTGKGDCPLDNAEGSRGFPRRRGPRTGPETDKERSVAVDNTGAWRGLRGAGPQLCKWLTDKALCGK